ncbi:hypothetical protein [Amycolatopsis sp. CA-230715]|uniref:hypothetical protein n=1 Tax=Amycolatopsis sp. CA-230715 TaxID=2745196 RepID=UPI001C035C20|nr:hypothetical protein [Amycolatopsis sp. CA-230715]QWF82751.1 hypothetical protein HUW46_06190 [Amycolatopsis sp. CA-230715]
MPDLVSVDGERIRLLSQEFRASADELRTRIEKFRVRAADTNGAYGETPNAEAAERAYRGKVVDTLDRLEKMHLGLIETANALAEQAKHFKNTTNEAESIASENHRPR